MRLDEYFESVRSVEQRIEAHYAAAKALDQPGQVSCWNGPLPAFPQDAREHVRLMLDILILAFWSDTTRIGTFMFGDAQSGYGLLVPAGVKGGFH